MAIKIIRFNNGEEIIGDMKTNGDYITCINPAQIVMVPSQIQGQTSMALAPFMPYTKTKSFEFHVNNIMTFAEPIEQLYNQYNQIFGSGLIVPPSSLG